MCTPGHTAPWSLNYIIFESFPHFLNRVLNVLNSLAKSGCMIRFILGTFARFTNNFQETFPK